MDSGHDAWAVWFRRWTALSAVVLLLLTFRLWLPQADFPRVPLIAAAVGWSDGVDLLAFGAMLCGLLLTVTPQRERFGWWAFAAAFGLAVVTDQHRLQPWAYQFAILAVVFGTAGDRRQLTLARWLAIGIVFHSAHSKLDHAFLNEQGRTFVEFLAGAVGIDTKWWGERTWRTVAAALPIGELLIAVGLVAPRTRHIAAWLLIGMHTLLLLVFTGLAHSWGVLLWNVFSIGQALLLFTPWRPVRPETSEEQAKGPCGRRSAFALAEIAVGFAVLAPFLEPLGLFDHWPAWSVYSERTERVTLFVPVDAIDDLPESARANVVPVAFGEVARVRLDAWSLASLGVPLYPQERFRVGVAIAVVRTLPPDAPCRIVVDGLPGRFDGKREREVVEGRQAIEARAHRYRWNARPKRLPAAR